jgi:hypothetical protein
MQFTPENCTLILSGAKTMTRRVVKPEDGLVRADKSCSIIRISQGYPGGRTAYEVGKTYAIQPGRGQRTIFIKDGVSTLDPQVREKYKHWTKKALLANGWHLARLRITAIRREKLQDISTEDCVREGVEWRGVFRNEIHDAFKAIWDGLYANDPVKGWEASPDVWVISFELVEAEGG